MRLIDADDLKKYKVRSEERCEYVVPVYNIDNAPTVPVLDICKDCNSASYDNGFNAGYEAGKIDALRKWESADEKEGDAENE